MNKNLARYLFFNEVLYQPDKVQELVFEKVKEKSEEIKLPDFFSSTLIFSTVFTENEKQFLGNILKAVKMNYENVQIISEPIDFQLIFKTHKVKKIVVFGFQTSHFKLPSFYDKYQIYANEGIQLLFADQLPTIQANLRDEKRSLWNALQQLFL